MNLGAWGEEQAARYLREAGYRVIARNYRCRFGEMDLIAEDGSYLAFDGSYLAFVEVKTRSGSRFGSPAQAVTYSKQKKLTVTAQAWLTEHPTMLQPRFDVIEVLTTRGCSAVKITHLTNAFEAIE